MLSNYRAIAISIFLYAKVASPTHNTKHGWPKSVLIFPSAYLFVTKGNKRVAWGDKISGCAAKGEEQRPLKKLRLT